MEGWKAKRKERNKVEKKEGEKQENFEERIKRKSQEQEEIKR